MKPKEIEELANSLTLEEKIGQMLCYNYSNKYTWEEWEEAVKETHAGAFFVANETPETIRKCTDLVNLHSKIPCMIAADVENGPGHILKGETLLPNPMAWGACGDADLIEKAHRATAERCREMGIHWTFSPIVDINYNPDNPITNIRAISDKPELVAKIATAAVRGFQHKGLMVAGCKHFPGDGMDDRNQHFCTTVNSMSREEWMNTYGYIYKEMFKSGAASVMVGHISLPAFDEKLNDWLGYPPGSISYNLQTKLLKEELGFEGCIVSDALSMVGACAALPADRLAVEFVKSGGDMLLFPLREYYDQILSAVQRGEISEERIHDAVVRVLTLKDKARLFEREEDVQKDICHEYDLEELSLKIAEKSITMIRNFDDALPLSLQPNDKILILNLKRSREPEEKFQCADLNVLEEELKNRGYRTVSYTNPSRKEFTEDLADSAVVLVNIKLSCQDYDGGSLRIGWEHIRPFWRGWVLRHPKVIVTSFGDPYKIHDFPYLKTYVNTYSYAPSTQRAFVKALLGEIPFMGESPVSFREYF